MGDNKKEIERANLHNTIWKIADELRGSIDGWDFKQYVLGFLFYRFISENICRYINDYESKCEDPQFEDYAQLNDSDITDDWKKAVVDEKGFFIMPSQLFTNVNKCAQDDANL
ncbi:type I restriction-modification system subunit M N-terminal domain-containing protein, partial [Mycoplasmopsis primatum]|uniref:type I restriction-modification system subunit M N-terminal domain-containing protein n=1 Tax=Mycoplasmopsis primatum TaxID=55604 RepID=UPI00049717C9